MASQLWLIVRMLLYPAMGAVVFDGFTHFDPDTGAYTLYLPQIGAGLIGYALTFVSSRFASMK